MLSKLLFVYIISTLSLYASWDEYKSFYIAEDGRVIDKVNKGITHSESIGYALSLSLKNNDLSTFEKVFHWYKNNLKKNEFGLISWSWGLNKKNEWGVLDTNNATDGDLLIAYNSLLMYEKTNIVSYKQEALELMRNIKKHLLVKEAGSLYLLPGKIGFQTNKNITINLSYYLFYIFDKFYLYDYDQVWKKITKDGIALMKKARFSTLSLNADWICVNKKTAEVKITKNNSFGYDAIRIPFNIIQSNINEKEKHILLEPYINYVNAMKLTHSIYGVSNLSDGRIFLYNYSYGHLCIYNMIDYYINKTKSFSKQINILKEKNKDDYYSYSIYLFSTGI